MAKITSTKTARKTLKKIQASESNSARFTILLNPDMKAAFEKLCATQDITPSQVTRRLIGEYLHRYGIDY